MAKIDSFRAQLVGGGARANQFKVRLQFPGQLGGADQRGAQEKAEFMVRGANLPASRFTDIPVFYRGRPTKVAGDREFEDWTITVYNDNDFRIRNAMESWMASIANHTGSGGILTSSQYQTTLYVDQLDRNDKVIKTYEFRNAFPKEVSAIDLNFDAQAAIEEFTVTFGLDYWVSDVIAPAEAKSS